MTHSLRVAGVVALAALMTFASSASALTWTCEGIARKGFPDPAGASFAGKFGGGRHGGPAINGAGDVTFGFGPGPSTLVPIMGDWDGNNTDTAGLYDPATGAFFLKSRSSFASDLLCFGLAMTMLAIRMIGD